MRSRIVMKNSGRLRQRPSLETLEGRLLLAAPITEFPIPAGSPGITNAPDGDLWFTLFDNQIGRVTPNGQVTAFPVPETTFGPARIATGPDGNLWFTYLMDYQVGRITPAGQVTVFPTPSGNHSSPPEDIVAGSDGNLWFTETTGNKIGRITPTGQVAEFPVSLYPGTIKAGPDGNLWFTETGPGTSTIGRITTGGQVTEFPLYGRLSNGEAFDPDGNLWFTEGVLTAITSGRVAGAAKNTDYLGRITPTGQITEIPLSGTVASRDLILGPDGNLWFTDHDGNAIGRITSNGLVAEFAVPTSGSGPVGIVAGPDGNLWFTEDTGENIGRFRVSTTDLVLSLPAQPVTGVTGQPLTYAISVTNHGPVEATDVVLTEEIPPFTVPVPVISTSRPPSYTSSQGTVNPIAAGGFVAELGNLASGATATVTIVMTSTSPQTITSRLTVHANESDADPADDTGILSTTISKGPSSIPTPASPPNVLSLGSILRQAKGAHGDRRPFRSADGPCTHHQHRHLSSRCSWQDKEGPPQGREPLLGKLRCFLLLRQAVIAEARQDRHASTHNRAIRGPICQRDRVARQRLCRPRPRVRRAGAGELSVPFVRSVLRIFIMSILPIPSGVLPFGLTEKRDQNRSSIPTNDLSDRPKKSGIRASDSVADGFSFHGHGPGNAPSERPWVRHPIVNRESRRYFDGEETPRLHADRAPGGDRDHRGPDRPAAARGPGRPRGGAAGPVRQQREAARPGDPQLRVGPLDAPARAGSGRRCRASRSPRSSRVRRTRPGSRRCSPQFEQQALSNAFNFSIGIEGPPGADGMPIGFAINSTVYGTKLAAFQCPSDNDRDLNLIWPSNGYRDPGDARELRRELGQHPVGPAELRRRHGDARISPSSIGSRPSATPPIRLAAIIDGTSSTVFTAETLQGQDQRRPRRGLDPRCSLHEPVHPERHEGLLRRRRPAGRRRRPPRRRVLRQ